MNKRQKMYVSFKTTSDFILGWVGLAILTPVVILIGLIIKLDSKGPVLFKQKRVGKNKKHFIIYKFRTMRIDTPSELPTHKMTNPDQWITSIGRLLRKTSLDEIPQIINIAFGQMSFIGPRPALWNQFDLVEARDLHGVNQLSPGITGWAQVHGRDSLTIKEKAKLDGVYIKKLSFKTDIYILFKTIIAVFKKDGIVEGGTSTLGKKEADDE